MQPDEQEVRQVRKDVDTIAETVSSFLSGLDWRLEGIRRDFEVALLEEHTRLVRRMERMEAMLGEVAGEEMARSLLVQLGGEGG